MGNNDNSLIEEEHEKKTAIAVMDKEDSQAVVHEYSDLEIQKMIYKIRGQQVMLDSDLAKLYGYEAKKFNQQVKRNIERFPKDFMFQISKEEEEILGSQNGTSRLHGGRRYIPYVFTEQGIYMLSSVLKGDLAIRQSVSIMRTFKEMRHFINKNKQLINPYDILKIENRLYDNEQTIRRIENTMTTKDDMEITMNKIMDSFIPKESIKQFVFKDDQMFEANVAYINIYKEAKHSIYIVDDYINCQTLSLLTAKSDGVDVIIFSDNKGRGSEKLNELEFNNFNREYPTLSFKRNNRKCHDRFIILDYKTETEKIYHCGASSKDAGKRACCISLFLTSDIIHLIIDELLTNENYMF